MVIGKANEMIYVTGDTHRMLNIRKLDQSHFNVQSKLTKEDYLVIMGDFGGVWDKTKYNERCLEYHNKKQYTTLFIDGNHENFDLLNSYPVERWNGGKVHRIKENILHLMRGQVFNIDGVKIFTMGGASSIDKEFRVPGRTWWYEEDLSKSEIDEAITNLNKCNWEVDYVFTHATANLIATDLFGYIKEASVINKFLDVISINLKYKWWFFGHYHEDKVNTEWQCTCLFNNIRTLENTIVSKGKYDDSK